MSLKNMPEWNDLPPEMQKMVVEKCDFITRNSLRLSNSSLKHLVDVSKLYLPSVTIKERMHGDIHLGFSFKLFERELLLKFEKKFQIQPEIPTVTLKKREGKEVEEMNGKTPVDVALQIFKQTCLHKRVTIGRLFVETIGESAELAEKLEKILENSEIPKILAVFWRKESNSNFGWKILEFCRHLEELKITGTLPDPLPIFQKIDSKILKNLKKLDVIGDVEATDDDILALKLSKIHLKSEKFTEKLTEELLRRMMEKQEIGSFFMLKKSENGAELLKSIPPGFEKIDNVIGHNLNLSSYKLKISPKTEIHLKIGSHGVLAQVVETNSSTTSFFEEQKEKCLKNVKCQCQQPMYVIEDDDDFDIAYDGYEDEEDSIDHEEGWFAYSSDDGGWRSDSDFDD